MKKLVKLIEKAKLEKVDMEILIERFLPLIRRLAHKLPYEYQDAEQDMKLVFLELIHKISLRDMRNQEDKYLLKYIETTMNNHCFDLCHKYYRDKGREQPLEETAVILPDGVPFEDLTELEQFFKALTKLQKQILIAEYVYGYSETELSEKLHITRQAVNRTNNRALHELRISYRKGGM